MTVDIRDRSLWLRKNSKIRNQIPLVNEFNKQLAKINPRISLELGCGEGFYTEICCSKSKKVIAIDIENNISPSLRSNGPIFFVIASATHLPFKDSIFDFVYSFDVIEHIDDDRKFINENFRVLNDNRYLIISTPNRDRLYSRIRRFFKKEIKYPYYLGHHVVLGDIIHIREYSKKELYELINKIHPAKSIEIKGLFLGVSNFGFSRGAKSLENFMQIIFLIAKK